MMIKLNRFLQSNLPGGQYPLARRACRACLACLARLACLDHLDPLARIVSLTLLAACSSEPSREELAGLAAKGYYQHLISGQYDQFLEGRLGADSLPADYRSQLIEGYKQYVAQQEVRKGIREVQVSRAYTDSLADYTSVLLMLCYGDSTTEEVVVPMVEHNGRWRMK